VNDLHVRWVDDGQAQRGGELPRRHLMKRPDQTAILWEPDDPNEPGRMRRYRELQSACAVRERVVKRHRVQKGDRSRSTADDSPTVTEMLAAARIGA